ncbi:hypothetical protein FQV39_17100 [Bosea sp. F3-2]|uniref:hypothetical protein n=1 Tax=Bosea sp. F3-2 TaxID=2599640 RepID=UPI0011EE839E|nr:hypothetical protein [Bosea sp. F3-2]QEL24106.1 hypothetical protein FQV39_17100 [Bosea sp. F3-2]
MAPKPERRAIVPEGNASTADALNGLPDPARGRANVTPPPIARRVGPSLALLSSATTMPAQIETVCTAWCHYEVKAQSSASHEALPFEQAMNMTQHIKPNHDQCVIFLKCALLCVSAKNPEDERLRKAIELVLDAAVYADGARATSNVVQFCRRDTRVND